MLIALIVACVILFGTSAFLAVKFLRQFEAFQNLNSQNALLSQELNQKNAHLQTINEHLQNAQNQCENLQNENTNLRFDTQNLRLQLQNAQENLSAQKTQSAQDLQNLKDEFSKNLAFLKDEFQAQIKAQSTSILESNKLNLMQDSKAILGEIFAPIAKSVGEYSQTLQKSEVQLQTNIKNMFDFAQKLGNDADKLARILKGDKKVRGDFAELQLKTILQNSGLVAGEQYKLQEHLQIDGSAYRPDAIVYLDKQKSIVIDAKFSLPNASFEDFALEFGADSEIALQIAKNLRARIDELAKKPYSTLKMHSYDFVLLFIPYQNILDLALSADDKIYQYAYSKKIYLTTPHTLFMALKTIEISWQGIQSDEKVQSAFVEIGKFYDKFVGVLENFENLKRTLRRADEQAQLLDTQLQTGRGNLADKFENLKALGAKTNKAIAKRQKLLELDSESVDSQN